MKRLLQIWPTLRPHRWKYASGLAFVLTGSVLGVLGPLILREAVDRLDSGAPGSLSLFAGALVLLAMAKGVLSFRGRYSIIAASRDFEYDLRQKIYAKLLRLPARFFDTNSTGDIESRVINDVDGVRMVAGIALMMLVSSGILFILSLSAMVMIDPLLAGLILVPLALVIVVTARLTGKIYRQSEEVQERLGDLSTIAQENFTGARILRAFSREGFQNSLFAGGSARYRDANLSLALTRATAWGSMAWLIETTFGMTLLAGGYAIIQGTMTKGDLVAFLAYQFMLAWPVIAMGWVITIVQRGAACWDRLSLILQTPDDESLPAPVAEPPVRGDIEVRGLTFRYDDERPAALKNVTLRIRAGERVALVGRTGSGKTTLASILLGLYRPPKGTVFIDGRDINDYSRRALRSSMGSVLQDTFLFSDKISANIAFGKSDSATTTKEEILAAAEASRISEDIPKFPKGLDTVIGERGITLSGGQRQRTALARALIRRPRIMILDDTLSSVDVNTEKEILDRLDEWLKGQTCLIVTHRFSIAPRVDRVLVFDDGSLVEEGTHTELSAGGGLYARLLDRQRLEEALEDER